MIQASGLGLANVGASKAIHVGTEALECSVKDGRLGRRVVGRRSDLGSRKMPSAKGIRSMSPRSISTVNPDLMPPST